ncbi:MAG: Nif3-like dinuclear metal center hexameric protein [Candidatus Sumerlaeia bacterium]|nr:Nif3-like dinuclear metal center hexameric protein [Candidatus Sumerlaeia bacterium]
MPLTISEVLDLIDTLAPWETADFNDNVGLLFGSPAQRVKKILVALEVSVPVIETASQQKADLLIVHHPLIYQPLNRINYDSYPGKLIYELMKINVALIAVHTNLDKSRYGTNFALASLLGLEQTDFLLPNQTKIRNYKFVVFVPEGYEGKIIDAIARGGGGIIGNYSHCTFRSPGTGTFIPLSGAKPFIGEQGKLESVQEFRLESLVPSSRLRKVLTEVLKVHPYEEPAYDIYPLYEAKSVSGIGCVGELKKACTLRSLVQKIKRQLSAVNIQVVGELQTRVKRVAICTGAADKIVTQLQPNVADVIVVGEISHHTALTAKINRINVIAAGHYETEIVGMNQFGRILSELPQIRKNNVKIIRFEKSASPFKE